MESRELSLFLKRHTLKPEADVGGDVTRRFAMNHVGRMIAAAQQDRSIRLYDARNCEEMQRIQDDVLCTSIAFSPKGDILATGSVGRVIKLWDIREGTPITTLEGHTYPVLGLSFSPDGDHLVSASGDTTLIIWDMNSLKQAHQLKGHSLYVVSCDWDPQGNRIVSSSVDSAICEWDPNTGALQHRHEEHRTAVQSVRFSRDGSRLASASSDHSVILWDSTDSLKVEKKLLGHEEEVRAASFSYDGRYLASGSADKDLFVWSVDTYSIEGEGTTPSEVDGIEWYPDTLAFLSSDGTGSIVRWEVQKLNAMLEPFNELLREIESDPTLARKDELILKYEDLVSQYDEESLRDKRLFYVNWQCKKALDLLKGKTRGTT
ncbi:MAG: WD40 repeat domain-containing protein [Candidatus Thorarchaeota archaeon]